MIFKLNDMFDIEINNIARITERVLGHPRHETDTEGWTEYNCPYCADFDGVESDGKYNCCVNYREGYFHCWKCGTAGKISRVLKDYGGSSLVGEYYDEIRNIRNSQEYQLFQENTLVKNELIEVENAVKLPENFRLISSADKESYSAYRYLKERGLDYKIINEFGIGYVPWSDDYKMRCRIIIPSYDQYKNLNYYVARDYTNKQKRKAMNPDVNKKEIIFNEGKINWCENIYLVEGPMDAISVPNSIPLLGKVLKEDFALYEAIVEKARANVIIMLDNDAIDDAREMYRFLNCGALKDRVRIIECPNGYDPSLFYQKFGKAGMLKLMRSARRLKEYELL